MDESTYIYLHGLASSPDSFKAQYLKGRFFEQQIDLKIPDLDRGDFYRLTLSRQIQQVSSDINKFQSPVTLIGSSLGGLTAAWVAERSPQVKRLILLAPAFGFLSHWLKQLGERQVKQWQTTGELQVYHYAAKRLLPLSYEFIRDGQQYAIESLQRAIPTLILHGKRDEVVPIESSRSYARQRPWVELIELDSEHGLTDMMSFIWERIQQFCD